MKPRPRIPQVRSTAGGRLPLRWEEVPHQELLERTYQSMGLLSAKRAADDSLRFILKRRLPSNDPSDHAKYIEIESARIVETLRHLRNQYRAYFEERGCSPISEMHWVVLRHGVKDWAIMALRSAAVEYIEASGVDAKEWAALYEFSDLYSDPHQLLMASTILLTTVSVKEKLTKTIATLLPQTAFDQIIDGGPFGREYQIYLAQSYPGRAFPNGLDTLQDAIKRREKRWDDARPWSDGLSTLFAVTQQEISAQFDALGPEAREAERRFVALPAFERISYTLLRSGGQERGAAKATSKDRWSKIMLTLDDAGLLPDGELEGVAREVLMVARRKGAKLLTWTDCYASCTNLRLEDAKVRTVRREVTRAIQNAAKKAEYHLVKVWGRKAASVKQTSKASPSSRIGKGKSGQA